MLNKITSAPKKAAAHVARHRVGYASTASFAAGMVLMRKLDSDTYGMAMDFLKEKDLYEEFFTLTDEV
jgi:hypothetical protein